MEMNIWYDFDTATPLLEFLTELKDVIAGKQLTEHYSNVLSPGTSEEPIALRFEDVVVVFYSLLISTMSIAVLTAEDFEKDPTLNFLYSDIPGSKNVCHSISYVPDSPYEGLYVSDITLNRFSQTHELNPYTDEIRSVVGDFFSNITLKFTSGKEISVCGEDAFMDGYMRIDCEDLPWNYDHWWENTGIASESNLLETFNSFDVTSLPISEIWSRGFSMTRDRETDGNGGLYAEFGTGEPLYFCFSGTSRCLEIFVDGFDTNPSKYSIRSKNYPKLFHEQHKHWSYIRANPILASCLGKRIVAMEFSDVHEKWHHSRRLILRLSDGTGISMCAYLGGRMQVHLVDSKNFVVIQKRKKRNITPHS